MFRAINAIINMKTTQRLVLLAVVLFILLSNIALSKPTFPKLTGRVVDNANMLNEQREQRLTTLLEGHENATTNQVVIVTLPNLGGYTIETFGYQLGRHWGIGQKGKDNGVLLIVAKKERKVRIEVGYGLEGTLTDAISSNIIHRVIVPSFKKAKFGAGIEQGTHAIIEALGGQYQLKQTKKKKSPEVGLFAMFFILFFVFWTIIGVPASSRDKNRGHRGYYGGTGGGGIPVRRSHRAIVQGQGRGFESGYSGIELQGHG